MGKDVSIYTFKTIDVGYHCIKCDEDFNYETTYLMVRALDDPKKWICSCPASVTCRHITMRAKFEAKNRFDKPWWYDFAQEKWIKIRLPW